jgi:hypothetical protein
MKALLALGGQTISAALVDVNRRLGPHDDSSIVDIVSHGDLVEIYPARAPAVKKVEDPSLKGLSEARATQPRKKTNLGGIARVSSLPGLASCAAIDANPEMDHCLGDSGDECEDSDVGTREGRQGDEQEEDGQVEGAEEEARVIDEVHEGDEGGEEEEAAVDPIVSPEEGVAFDEEVRDDALLPPRILTGWAAGQRGLGVKYEAHPIPWMDGGLGLAGNVKVNIESQSLDFHCPRCSLKRDRKWLPFFNSKLEQIGPQGRMIGFFLAGAQFKCNGNKVHHATFLRTMTRPMRQHARLWGMAVPSLAPLFGYERAVRDDESDDEPLRSP